MPKKIDHLRQLNDQAFHSKRKTKQKEEKRKESVTPVQMR